jgi:hypothetical protein
MERSGLHVFRRWVLTLLLAFFAGGFSKGAPPQDSDDDVMKWWGPFQVNGTVGLSAVFVDVNGSQEKYRTDYNYLPGVNLSEFSLNLLSEGEGLSWLDYFKLDGNGFGDAFPYERANLLFGKRGLYEFQGRYWKQDYYFNVPTFALGDHSDTSARRVFDLNFRLFPHRSVVVDAGYIRNRQYGTAFTSLLKFQNLVEMKRPRDAVTQDFRVGASFHTQSFRASVYQTFRKYEEELQQEENRLLDAGTLPNVSASLPVEMTVPITQITAGYSPSARWMVEGKYSYSKGSAEAGRDEFSALKLTEGLTLEEVIRANSVSDRPEHRGEVEARFDLTDRLVFSNIFELRKFEIDGDYFQEMKLGSAENDGTMVFSQEASTFIDYRMIRNRPELEYLVSPAVSVFGGYQYEDRLVERELELFSGFDQSRQTRVTHSGFGGVSWRPYSGSRVFLEFEGGTANDAFTNTEARDITRMRVSTQFPVANGFSISPHLVYASHSNKTSDHSFDSEQWQGGFEVFYLDPGERFQATAGYTLFDLESVADLRFYFEGDLTDGFSDYRTQLHFLHSRLVLPIGERLRLRLGYQWLRDGEGNSYPLKRHLGDAGLMVLLPSGWSFDVAWHHVSYNEDLEYLQDYMANRLGVTLRRGY